MMLIGTVLPLAASDGIPKYIPWGKGVYYDGNVHFVTFGTTPVVAHIQHNPTPSNWKFDMESAPTATTPLPRTDLLNFTWGGNGIMDDKIFFCFTLTVGSSWDKAQPWLYYGYFDLAKNTFSTLKQLQLNIYGDIHQPVRSALMVFQDKVFIITNSKTLTSADGTNWADQANPILTEGDNLTPLDAINFVPEGDAPGSVMLLCASTTNPQGGGTWAAVWDCNWGNPVQKTEIDTNGLVVGWLYNATVKPPSSGNASKYHAGQVNPCIQAFVSRDAWPNGDPTLQGEHGLVRFEYNVTTQSWSMDSYIKDPDCNFGLLTFPNYIQEQSTTGDTRPIQRQYIGINCLGGVMVPTSWTNFAFYSDAMVPQNYDSSANGCGWEGTPTATSEGTQQENQKLRNYWSLVGVILGPPPFAVNDTTEDIELHELSNVIYGSEENSKVSHSQTSENTLMLGTDTEVKFGVKDKWGIGASFDYGFKYAWESGHKSSSSTVVGGHFKFGTMSEDGGEIAENWGRHGWLLFNSPLMVTQWFKLYAYDYKAGDDTSGTYLKRDIQTVQAKGIILQDVGFDLAEPGGSMDEIPGLCVGMRPFPYSQQLNGWQEMNWEDPDAPWSILCGTGTGGGYPVTPVHQGSPGGDYFDTGSESADTTGTTMGNEVSAGIQFSLGTDVKGFSEKLTAGYDSQLSFQNKFSTGSSSDIKYDLEMPYTTCGDPGCVTMLQVQPYWLMATEDTAPWIPSGYSGQLPWCMTWRVNKFASASFEEIGPGGHLPDDSSVDIGNGTVAELDGEEEAAREKWDSFSLSGGSLEWLGDDGGTRPIPLTADTFDTASGAEVKIGGYILKSDPASGRWTRHGQVWRYKTRDKSGPPAWTLELNFAKQSWSIDAKKLVLHDKIPAAKRHIRVELILHGKYTLYGDILYRSRVQWRHEAPAQDTGGITVTSYSGSFDSATEEGVVEMEGTLPSAIQSFGDTTFVFNGFSHHIPLLSMEEFSYSMKSGKELVYKREGLVVRVDFGKKRWSASFKKDFVRREMAPKWGRCKLEIRVGSELHYSKDIQIDNFKSKLTYRIGVGRAG